MKVFISWSRIQFVELVEAEHFVAGGVSMEDMNAEYEDELAPLSKL